MPGGGEEREGGRKKKICQFLSQKDRDRVTQREKVRRKNECVYRRILSLSLLPHFSHVFIFPIVRATHYWLNVLHPQLSLECIREILLSFVRVFKNLLT